MRWTCFTFDDFQKYIIIKLYFADGKRVHLPSFLDLTNGLYSCRFCDFCHDQVDVAQEHIKDHHFEVRAFLLPIGGGTYKCAQCNHPPNNLANVKSHIESKHYSPGYPCRICGRAYAIEKAVKRHMKKCQDYKINSF